MILAHLTVKHTPSRTLEVISFIPDIQDFKGLKKYCKNNYCTGSYKYVNLQIEPLFNNVN